jgi:hypothetical protein
VECGRYRITSQNSSKGRAAYGSMLNIIEKEEAHVEKP